jgi:hypothetical protein
MKGIANLHDFPLVASNAKGFQMFRCRWIPNDFPMIGEGLYFPFSRPQVAGSTRKRMVCADAFDPLVTAETVGIVDFFRCHGMGGHEANREK